MIEVRNVCKHFENVTALDGLHLTVPDGSVCGLVGPNGAGKSTLMKCLAGVLRPDEGELLVGGQPIFENPAAKAGLVCIPDEIAYFAQASTLDMMRFYSEIYPTFDGALFERLGKAFDFDPKTPLRRLSRGMRKQAAFRLAIALRPKYLLLDEPVDGLDPVMRRRIWGLVMADVAENGTTVLVSSHNLRELEDVCDRVAIIRSGKMLLEENLSDLQGSIVKIQTALHEGGELPQLTGVVHHAQTGSVHTLIVHGDVEAAGAALQAAGPLFMDVLPLSLEEIFIYEIGGDQIEINDILL